MSVCVVSVCVCVAPRDEHAPAPGPTQPAANQLESASGSAKRPIHTPALCAVRGEVAGVCNGKNVNSPPPSTLKVSAHTLHKE